MAQKVIQGNTTGSISTIPLNIASKIVSFFLTNRTGGTIILNMYVVTGTGNRAMIPVDLHQISGTMYISDTEIFLEKDSYIMLVTNGSVDYYFCLE